jgi:hypothetical protein
VEKGSGAFELVWIEGTALTSPFVSYFLSDRIPVDPNFPNTREIVTLLGKAETSYDGM